MNLQELKQLNRPFELSDFSTPEERSDGIGECIEIIQNAGGKVSQDGFITPPVAYEDVVSYSISYLIDEWDYAFESWRRTDEFKDANERLEVKTGGSWKSIQINGVPSDVANQIETNIENGVKSSVYEIPDSDMNTSLSPEEFEDWIKEEEVNGKEWLENNVKPLEDPYSKNTFDSNIVDTSTDPEHN